MTAIGVLVGNRGFFPNHLCETGRESILRVLEEAGLEPVIPPVEATPYGAIETVADARKYADYFKQHRDRIEGVLVTLPNFGDERAVANTLRWAGLDVPVLIHAFNDRAGHMTSVNRRDSFCGKMSVCNNLRQYGIPYSLTSRHTMDPDSPAFAEDLEWFAAVCRVVKALRHARFGALGARPAAFNTVRYSEKLLEAAGISIETIDLSEILEKARVMKESDPAVEAKVAAIRDYVITAGVPEAALLRMACLGVAIDNWMCEQELTATAIQCWTSLEECYGVVPCTLMSMMSQNLMPSACEVDISGLIGMVALQAASGQPSALLDWNNNYGDDPDKGVAFHCSNLPKAFLDAPKMDYQAIIAGAVGQDNTWGTVCGRIQPGPFSYCRVSTDDIYGCIRGYVGEGRMTDDPLETFGGYGVFEIPKLQKLLAHICENGFEHHVAANRTQVAAAVHEALTRYLEWDIYSHEMPERWERL